MRAVFYKLAVWISAIRVSLVQLPEQTHDCYILKTA